MVSALAAASIAADQHDRNAASWSGMPSVSVTAAPQASIAASIASLLAMVIPLYSLEMAGEAALNSSMISMSKSVLYRMLY